MCRTLDKVLSFYSARRIIQRPRRWLHTILCAERVGITPVPVRGTNDLFTEDPKSLVTKKLSQPCPFTVGCRNPTKSRHFSSDT